MCSPVAGFTANPGVSRFTLSFAFAPSLIFSSSLALPSPFAARLSSEDGEEEDRDHYGKMRATIERRIRGRQ